jgi:uncharacterized protein (TIGR03437 family)
LRYMIKFGLLVALPALAARLDQRVPEVRMTALPKVYEANRGQAAPGVRYLSRQHGYTAFFLDDSVGFVFPRIKPAPIEPVLSLKPPRHAESLAPESMRMRWLGGKPVKPTGEQALPSVSNYYVGNDKSRWRTDVPHFGDVHYQGIYDGIDLTFGRRGQSVEYRFIIAPSTDPSRIRLSLDARVRLEESGNLTVTTESGKMSMSRPQAWQGTTQVDCQFAVDSRGEITFVLRDYDSSQELVIDPVIEYLTYLGGNTYDAAAAIAVDSQGAAYVTGYLQSPQYPVLDPFQQVTGSTQDVFVAKISPQGNRLIFYAYLGGSYMDAGSQIAVDTGFNVYVAGWTASPDFGLRNPAQAVFGGGYENAFLAKLNGQGKLTYATYLGGSNQERPSAMVVDEVGAIYVCGFSYSGDFPVKNALQPKPKSRPDGILAKLAPEGNRFLFATYFGGSGFDYAHGLALDGDKNIYVSGFTSSVDLPTTQGVLQREFLSRSGENAFVAKLSPAADRVLAATYFGGTSSVAVFAVQLNSKGNVWLLGNTTADGLPVKNPIQAKPAGMTDVVLVRLSGDLKELQYSTLFGGSQDDIARWGLAIDRDDSVIVTGFTYSPDFPLLGSLSKFRGADIGYKNDAFILKFAPEGNPLIYSTLIAGNGQDFADNVALDAQGGIYVGMTTGSTDLPVKNPLQARYGGGSQDMAILKIAAERNAGIPPLAISPSTLPFESTVGQADPPPQTVQLSATTGGSIAYAASVEYGTGSGWLVVTPVAGSTPSALRIGVKSDGLASGDYRATVGVNGAGALLGITVSLHVYAVSAKMTSLDPSVIPARSDDTVVTVKGGGFVPGSLVQLGTAPLPTVFVDASTLHVTLSRSLLSNEFTFQLVVVNPQSKPSAGLVMTIGRPLPDISFNGVTNAASYRSGVISPGMLVTVFGTRLGPDKLAGAEIGADGQISTLLAGTKLLIDGMESPLLYVSGSQVGAIVPFEVAGKQTVQVQVESNGQRSPARELQVRDVTPAVFTADASGSGFAAALNQDGSVNSPGNASARSEVVVLYATGTGLLSPAQADGSLAGTVLARPVAGLKVFIDGIDSEVLYVGGAPGLVAGVIQVNVRVPREASLGGVVVQVAGFDSQEGVFIALRD